MASSGNFWETVGLVFRIAFRIAPTALPIAAVFALPVAVAFVLLATLPEALAELGPGALDLPLRAFTFALPTIVVALGSLALAFAIVYPLVNGALAWVGARAVSGERVTLGQAAGRVAQRGPVAVGAFLAGMVVVGAAPVGLGLLAVVAGVVVGAWAAAILVLLVVVALVYPGFVYGIRFSLGPAVAMTEDVGPLRALGRSAEIVRGGFWWVFGLFVLSGLVGGLVAGAITGPVGAAAAGGAAALVATGVAQAVANALSMSVSGIAVGVAYAVRTRPRDLVRAATATDARAIAEVHVRAWRAAYRGQLPDELLDELSIPEREVFWRQAVEGPQAEHRVWVADRSGRVVGFADTGRSRDDDASAGTAEVNAIYVLPEEWGAGVGRALMAHAVDDLRARGFGEATLWVLETNDRTRRFYEGAGWHDDGGRKTETRGDAVLREMRYRTVL